MLQHAYEPSTWLPYLLLLNEFVGQLAWPVALLISVFLLRDQIKEAVGRVIGVKGAGFELTMLQSSGSDLRIEGAAAGPPLTMVPKTQALNDVEMFVREQLEKIDENRQIDELVGAVASERLDKHFALVYSGIFGSQIRALQILLNRGGHMQLVEVEKLYVDFKEQNGAFENLDLMVYLDFLERNFLVNLSADSVAITPIGKDFLSFLPRYHLSIDRAL